MVVKMMKWSPWPTLATRRYKVKVKSMKLLLGCSDDDDDDIDHSACALDQGDVEEKVIAIKMRWKGEPKFGLVPFHLPSSKQCRHFSREKVVKKLEEGNIKAIEWNGDEVLELENFCSFTIVSTSQDGRPKFAPWDVSFSLLYGEKKKKTESSKGKLVVIGRASLNIAEMVAGRMMEPSPDDYDLHQEVEAKLPINLQIGGITKEAHFLVLMDVAEIRDSHDSVPNSVDSSGVWNGGGGNSDESSGGVDKEDGGEANSVNDSGPCSDAQMEPAKKMGLFSWKRRRLSFKPTPVKGEPDDKKPARLKNEIDNDPQCSGSSKLDLVTSGSLQVEDKGDWESKEVISRDGQTELKTNVFFASFDQCSNKAAGESACTALVAVIAYWLQLNRDAVPTRPEFDDLIMEGSSEWRKLCENDAYTYDFPNKHFDLETVLHADVRPIAISRDDSFVGFFSPEKFEALKEAMSFDEIWEGISRVAEDHDPRVYIVSWNDHFFVLKVEANAYYIIDTLGERLCEGCNQAYILKFDDSSLMHGKSAKEDVNKAESSDSKSTNPNDIGEIICSGKECCKEFIKRFLAAIPLEELEEEEKKGAVSYYSLHHRLQIELNFSYVLPSSFTSSPFSSSSPTSASSSLTDVCI
ncbi:uncharacterized protein [Coffea arabica]|uniref:C2 NT-type domain-containing protein n=1 Tax=Coffea arabica TaxID=13443 RepID=A0ABM4VEK3_COFAR